MSMFLDIADVDGESTVTGFEDQMEILSFSFSSSLATSSVRSNTSHTTGRPSLSLFNFTKLCDKSTPMICKKLWSGATLATATFTACREEEGALTAFLTVEMKNVVFANYSVSSGGDMPYESISLNYSNIEINYIPQEDAGGTSGNIPASYDLTTESAEQ